MKRDNSLEDKITFIRNNIRETSELIIRTVRIKDVNKLEIKCVLVFLSTIVDMDMLNRDIISPMLYREEKLNKDYIIDDLKEKCIQIGAIETIQSLEECSKKLIQGNVLILVDKEEDIIICDIKNMPKRNIKETDMEKSLKGAREAFIEDIDQNIGLVRKRLADNNLSVVNINLGRRSQLQTSILSIDDIVDDDILNEIYNKIKNIDVDAIEDLGMLEQEIEGRTFSLFPQMNTTEKPDKVVADLLEGKVAIMLQGSPYALIAPVLLIDFLKYSEDNYIRFITGALGPIIRIISIFIMIYLPAYYLSLLVYHSAYVPLNLYDPIITSRSGIPFPPFIEIVISMLIVEILREGGIRLPSPIAQTLSVVGGIIFGQAALESRIISSTTLLVVGISTISSFIIQNTNMSIAIRVVSFIMLISSATFGIFGIIICTFLILTYLCSLDSFGVPYLAPFSPTKFSDIKDSIIIFPIKSMKKRSKSIPKKDYKRRN